MASAASAPVSRSGSAYLTVLSWAFAVCNSTRLITYLPTMWAIHVSGDSSQHSLMTWLAWFGANVTMAAWLFERNGRRFDCTVGISSGKALMCAATSALICFYR